MTISEQAVKNVATVWDSVRNRGGLTLTLLQDHVTDSRIHSWMASLAHAFGDVPIEQFSLAGCESGEGGRNDVLDAVGVAGARLVWARCELDPDGDEPISVRVFRLADVVALEVRVADNIRERAESIRDDAIPDYAPSAASVTLAMANGESVTVRANRSGRDMDMVLDLIRSFGT